MRHDFVVAHPIMVEHVVIIVGLKTIKHCRFASAALSIYNSRNLCVSQHHRGHCVLGLSTNILNSNSY